MRFYHIFTTKIWHQPINKNDLIQTMTAHTKHDINKRKDANANQSRTHHSCRAAIFHIYLGGIFLAYNTRIYGGGGFRLAIMRMYICGRIFALHNTHIKHGENPKNHNAKKPSRIHKNFRQKDVYVWAILKASCNTPILDPKSFPLQRFTELKNLSLFKIATQKILNKNDNFEKSKNLKQWYDYRDNKSNLLSDAK